MHKVTVSLEDRHLYELEARQHLGDASSRSEALRQILDEYEELHTEYETLEEEYEQLRTRYESKEDRIEQLEEQLSRRSQIEEKVEDLPDKIRGAETYQEKRQRALDRASVSQRLVWRFTGVPEEALEEIED